MAEAIMALAGINTHRPPPQGRPVSFTLQDGREKQLMLLPRDAQRATFKEMSEADRATLEWWLNPRHWRGPTAEA